MANLDAIQSIFTQVAIQAVTAAAIEMRETDAGPLSGTNTAHLREVHRQRHGRPALKQPSFNWNAPGKWVELLNFKKEVTYFKQKYTNLLGKKESP